MTKAPNANAPTATIVVPAYNVQETIAETIRSLLVQTMTDFELLIVDDGSSDDTLSIVETFKDERISVISQNNRGLAGAHNTGIAAARGRYIGFCDADDLWLPEKLERHIAHLDANPDVGISFSGSELIDKDGRSLGLYQSPKLKGISPVDIFKRNPIGNGSSAVIRAEALKGFAYRPPQETERDWWFDETFRQSDDIEGWLRFALTQDWLIEGIEGKLTKYRIHVGGLSADMRTQLKTWLRMRAKMAEIAPDFVEKHGDAAAAYQYRYLARRAVAMRDGDQAFNYVWQSLKASYRPLIEEPRKTVVTLAAAVMLKAIGARPYQWFEQMLLPSTQKSNTNEGALS